MVSSSLKIRQLVSKDVERVVALQSSCPEIAQWTARDYERVGKRELVGWVAEDEVGIPGFLVARPLVQETEILNFAVRADERHRGIGAALLKEALDWSRSIGAERVVLEVRASNQTAVKFYQRCGFRVVGRRPKYYTGPVDDALLLGLVLADDRNGFGNA